MYSSNSAMRFCNTDHCQNIKIGWNKDFGVVSLLVKYYCSEQHKLQSFPYFLKAFESRGMGEFNRGESGRCILPF